MNLKKILTLIILSIIFFVILISPVSNTGADSFGTLILSENIIRYKTIALNAYIDAFINQDGSLHYSVFTRSGNLYYNYPIGPSLFSLPIVFLVNKLGINITEINQPLQKAMAAFTSVVVIYILYLMLSIYFRAQISLMMASVIYFGTILSSTLGTSLWNINYEIIFTGIIILLILYQAHGQFMNGRGYIIGALLFCCYISRQNAAPFIVAILIYLFIKDRSSFWQGALASGLLFIIFSFWHIAKFGSIIPPAYGIYCASVKKSLWVISSNIIKSIHMLFFSASRNIVIWNPIILAVPFIVFKGWKQLKDKTLIIALILSSVAMLIINSVSYFAAYGGHFYGPRTSTSIVFLWIIAGIVVMGETYSGINRLKLHTTISTILLIIGLGVNLQGLYNQNVISWNSYPDIDQYPEEVIYDWQYPQFMANRSILYEKCKSQSERMGFYKPFFIPYYNKYILINYKQNDGKNIRTFEIKTPKYYYNNKMDDKYYLKIIILSVGLQRCLIFFNDELLGEIDIRRMITTGIVKIPGDIFNNKGVQRLSFISSSAPEHSFSVAFLKFVVRDYACYGNSIPKFLTE